MFSNDYVAGAQAEEYNVNLQLYNYFPSNNFCSQFSDSAQFGHNCHERVTDVTLLDGRHFVVDLFVADVEFSFLYKITFMTTHWFKG